MTLNIVSVSEELVTSQTVPSTVSSVLLDDISPGKVQVNRPLNDSSTFYRRDALYSVLIDGRDIDSLGWSQYLQKVEVRQRFSNVSEVILTFHNPQQGMFTGSEAFTPGSLIKVSMGYRKFGMTSLGVFKAQSPEHTFAPEIGHVVTLRGLSGESVLAAGGQRQMVWNNKSVSQIVSSIAQSHGLKSRVEDTGITLETVVQSNETSWAFLKKQADIYGYSLWLEDNTLRFGKYSPRASRGVLFFNTDDQSNLTELTIQVSANRTAQDFRQSQIDLDSQQVVSVSGDSSDPISKYVSRRINNSISAEEIVTEGGQPRSVEFSVGKGHTFDASEMRAKLEGMSRASKMAVVTLFAEGRGLEFLKAGETIPLIMGNADEFSGLFFIPEITHSISRSPIDPDKRMGYTTQVTLSRSFINPRSSAPRVSRYLDIDFGGWADFIDSLIRGPFKSFASGKASRGPIELGSLIQTGIEAITGE